MEIISHKCKERNYQTPKLNSWERKKKKRNKASLFHPKLRRENLLIGQLVQTWD